MLIEFNFKNFKVFKDETVFDLSATKMTEFSRRVATVGYEKILPVATVYGANAGGKTTLLEAFEFMTKFVCDSFGAQGNYEFTREPFILDEDSRKEPSVFEVYFTKRDDKKEKIYNYGFKINDDVILEEWFNVKAKTARNFKEIFHRGTDKVEFAGLGKSYKDIFGAGLTDTTLLASIGARMGERNCATIGEFFCGNEFIMNGLENAANKKDITDKYLNDEKFHHLMLEELRCLDKTILDVKVTKDDVTITHKLSDSDNTVEFPLKMESAGIKKLFAYFPKAYNVIDDGGILVIDNFDSGLHPLFIRKVLKDFFALNRENFEGQIIFTASTSSLMTNKAFRRDEIWFVEKDEKGISTLYSLADIVDEDGLHIRKDESYEKNYVTGKYGAIPDVFEEQI